MSTVPVWLISDYLQRLILKCSTSHRSPRSMLGEHFDGLLQRFLKGNNPSTLQVVIYIHLLAFPTRYFEYRLVRYDVLIPLPPDFFWPYPIPRNTRPCGDIASHSWTTALSPFNLWPMGNSLRRSWSGRWNMGHYRGLLEYGPWETSSCQRSKRTFICKDWTYSLRVLQFST